MDEGIPARYTYIWEYQVRPDRVDEFERLYGPQGEWSGLFWFPGSTTPGGVGATAHVATLPRRCRRTHPTPIEEPLRSASATRRVQDTVPYSAAAHDHRPRIAKFPTPITRYVP
jgi:hypothetical protein